MDHAGVFFGAMAGAHFAEELSARILRRAVAVLLLTIGIWEASTALRK
jgi:uncharacterized membrane protein YfcA